MAKDLNSGQSVATQDLKDADVVNQQDLKDAGSVDQQNQDDKLADGTDPNKPVPYSRLKEATDAKNEAEESKKAAEEMATHAQRQLELMQQQQIAQANPPQAPKTSMDQALADCNVAAEDMFGEAMTRVLARKDQIDAAKAQQQQAVSSIQQFIVSHPDLNEVVGSVNPTTGQLVTASAKVYALVAKKPHLAGASLPTLYDAVVQEDKIAEFEKAAAVDKEHQTRIDNETLPMSGSAAGGSGGSGDVQQQMMSREEQIEARRKVQSGEL